MARITLTRSYEHHGKMFAEIELREPKYKDFIAVGGEVWEPQRVNGQEVVITHHDRLDAYVRRLTISPPPEALAELDLADAIKLERTVGGFFTDALKSISPPIASSGAPVNKSAT